MPEQEDDATERLEKEEAMKIIGDLIAGNKGRDIYRGQSSTGWPLLPKALREEFKSGDHLEALSRFRRECWAFGLTATDSLEDLAIAQHFGLITYLLDWTTNPLVALFFACDEKPKENGEIFVLNNPVPIPEGDIEGDKWKDTEGLKLYNPRLIDPRITRQKGLFTIQGVEDKPLKELLHHPKELKPHAISANLKQKLIELLYTMGIDRSTLFPDPDGLCARINWETKNRIDRDFPPLTGSRVVYFSSKAVLKISATGTLKTSAPGDSSQPE